MRYNLANSIRIILEHRENNFPWELVRLSCPLLHTHYQSALTQLITKAKMMELVLGLPPLPKHSFVKKVIFSSKSVSNDNVNAHDVDTLKKTEREGLNGSVHL